MPEAMLLLGIDTCGPSGSVALGRLDGRGVEILGETELEGRNYSATLVTAVAGLLEQAGVTLAAVRGIVVVNGPGSFTGVRVGLSTAKGLAEGAGIPVVAVSRLEVLAGKAGAASAALDAHRGEVYLRVERMGQEPEELLAGERELAGIALVPMRVAVCDEGAASLLAAAWPETELVNCTAPLASDALRWCAARPMGAGGTDAALLDGHYLRRSDAEIFGEAAANGAQRA
jgi:tRNA threonylcarbamoyladenosine biosynthesis protein TsaB